MCFRATNSKAESKQKTKFLDQGGAPATDCFTAFVFINCFRLFFGTHPLLKSAERKGAGAGQVMNAWLHSDAETMREM